MLELEMNKGTFDEYVNLYEYMEENNLNEIEIISISYYSEHIEFLKGNANALFSSLFQDLSEYSFE